VEASELVPLYQALAHQIEHAHDVIGDVDVDYLLEAARHEDRLLEAEALSSARYAIVSAGDQLLKAARLAESCEAYAALLLRD
jgi:hypothetical protein